MPFCFCIPCFGVFAVIFVIAALVLWIWMIVEVATKEPSEDPDRLMWLLIVLLLGWVGGLVYLIARRPTRIQKYGR